MSEQPIDLEFSPTESKRFGLKIYRYTADHIEELRLLGLINRERADVVFLRVPADEATGLHRLDRVGLPYLVADTLVRYDADLTSEMSELRNPSLELRQLRHRDEAKLDSLVRTIFLGYKNHYSANPLLDTRNALAGYSEWASSFIDADDKMAFIAELDDAAVGFATCTIKRDESAGILYGVIPDAAGHGVYTDILRLTKRRLRELGATRMSVSTQVQNVAVQRTWVREGFEFTQSQLTVHLNPLFSASVREVDEFDFDDAFRHDQVASESILQYLNERYPGPRTEIKDYRCAVLAPLVHGGDYRVRISFPKIEPNGYHRAVVAIRDGENLCVLAYCNLINKT